MKKLGFIFLAIFCGIFELDSKDIECKYKGTNTTVQNILSWGSTLLYAYFKIGLEEEPDQNECLYNGTGNNNENEWKSINPFQDD